MLQEHRKPCLSFQADVLTTWRTAHSVVLKSDHQKTDPETRKLPTFDILLAFEEQMRRTQVEKNRKEKKTRGVQGMRGLYLHSITLTHDDVRLQILLQELVDQDKIKAGTKRKTVYSLIKDDERHTNVLGSPGPDPLELF